MSNLKHTCLKELRIPSLESENSQPVCLYNATEIKVHSRIINASTIISHISRTFRSERSQRHAGAGRVAATAAFSSAAAGRTRRQAAAAAAASTRERERKREGRNARAVNSRERSPGRDLWPSTYREVLRASLDRGLVERNHQDSSGFAPRDRERGSVCSAPVIANSEGKRTGKGSSSRRLSVHTRVYLSFSLSPARARCRVSSTGNAHLTNAGSLSSSRVEAEIPMKDWFFFCRAFRNG